jgi:serine/threonine protein kinase
MEYVEGQNVFQLLQKKGRFAEAEALAILVQVAQALSHVHGERLVHRDIKPENILVTPQGVAKLTDLGLAFDRADHGRRRITKVGVTMGTPFYLSPEQITGSGSQDVDIRSDIYSLGVTVYEMVTGQPPFAGEEPTSVLAKHLNEHAPSPRDIDRAISVGFCHILEKMLAKDPKARYQTPAELVEDLRLLKEGQALGSGRPPPGQSTVARPQSEPEPARARRTSGQILKPAPAEPARERPTGAARPSRRRHDGIVAVLNSPWALLVLAAALAGLIVVLTFVLRGRL